MGDINTNIRIDELESVVKDLQAKVAASVSAQYVSLGNINDLPKESMTEDEIAYWRNVFETSLTGGQPIIFKVYDTYEDDDCMWSSNYAIIRNEFSHRMECYIFFRGEYAGAYYAYIDLDGNDNGIWWYEES